MRPLSRELGLGLALFAAILGWSHRAVLTGSQVSSFSAGLPAEKTIRGIYEMVYQEPPAHWTAADLVRRGVFPSWTHLPEGGTPLIGKMQNGVFSPFRLHYYLVPARLTAWAQSMAPPMTALFAFIFVFLYARLVGAAWPWAAAAGGFYVFSGSMLAGHALFADNPSGLFLPALLCLIETSFRRGSRAVWLLPWAFALAFICGHFETAVRNVLAGGFYFLYRLRHEPLSAPEKIDRAVAFGVAGACGAALSLIQILPGLAYVSWSYNKVWRALPEYGWRFQTIQDTLGGDDTVVFGMAVVTAALCAWSARSWLRRGAIGWLAGAAAAGAVSLSAFFSLGLDMTGTTLIRMPNGLWGAGVVLLALSAAAAVATQGGTGARALAWLWLASVLILLKTPGIADLLAALPLFKSFNNTIYAPEHDLARVVLPALALQALAARARDSWNARLSAAGRGGLALAAACLAVWGGARLRPAVARTLGGSLGLHRVSAQPNGGVVAPGRLRVLEGSYEAVGWVSARAPAESVSLVLGELPPVPASWDGESGQRRWFRGAVTVPVGARSLTVLVKLRDGRDVRLDGPQLDGQAAPRRELLSLAALPLLPLAPWLGPAAAAGAVLRLARLNEPPTVPAGEFPLRLAGIDAIKKDASLFRIDSLQYGFLQADYPNLYGLADIRNGGDNLDVLPMIYYLFLKNDLMGRPQAEAKAASMALESLANVKYVVGPPEAEPWPGLKEIHRDAAMAVYVNPKAKPRAAFYESVRQVPLGDMRDWKGDGRKVFAAVGGVLLEKGFDPLSTLVLHDAPVAPPPASAPATAKTPTVTVDSYEANGVALTVDTPRAGYVMLADNLMPGWSAALDGKPVDILRAWLTFRAVAVPAGRTKLTFRYAPLDVTLGAAATIAALLAWAGLFVWALRRPSAPPPAAEPAAPKKGKKSAAIAAAPENPLAGPIEAATTWTLLALGIPCALFWLAWTTCAWDGGPKSRWGGSASASRL